MIYSIRLNGEKCARGRIPEPPRMLSKRDLLDTIVTDALEDREVELRFPFNLVVIIDGIAYRLCPTEEGSDWVQMLAVVS